ncbi:MAG: hypothetical protein Q6370_023550, partial [Candidatus Sigynarchaeota archaeon]
MVYADRSGRVMLGYALAGSGIFLSTTRHPTAFAIGSWAMDGHGRARLPGLVAISRNGGRGSPLPLHGGRPGARPGAVALPRTPSMRRKLYKAGGGNLFPIIRIQGTARHGTGI